MYPAYKLNKQGNNIQPWRTPFPIWNQSVVPCPVLTVASWPAYKFLKRQIRWSGIPISFRIFHSARNKWKQRCQYRVLGELGSGGEWGGVEGEREVMKGTWWGSEWLELGWGMQKGLWGRAFKPQSPSLSDAPAPDSWQLSPEPQPWALNHARWDMKCNKPHILATEQSLLLSKLSRVFSTSWGGKGLGNAGLYYPSKCDYS